MSRWPDAVREPLPVGAVTQADIDEALRLSVYYLNDPEDPAFDQATFGFVCAARSALGECAEILLLARAAREVGEPLDRTFVLETLGREYVAQKVARRVIDDMRRWVPESRYDR